VPYVFGDSEPAAQRLELVHEVFAETSRPFLQAQVTAPPRLAVDLGCGPGVCTRFVAEVTGARRSVGLDASEHFIRLARRLATPQVGFFLHDVTRLPFPVARADLLYCRLLLTHLGQPSEVLAGWASQLAPGGRLLIEEVESIQTAHPRFGEYLELVAGVVAAEGGDLYIGPRLEALDPIAGLKKSASTVRPLAVENVHAARMFALNLPSWKDHPFVRQHHSAEWVEQLQADLDAIARDTSGARDTEWGMRQLVFEAA
jgi:trans-aconitate 2-methyltransferase